MKRVQKLLGFCLIGSLLAVHPISGADFSAITGEGVGEAIAWYLNSFFLQSVGGEGGNPQPPMDGGKASDNKKLGDQISDDQIIKYMNFLLFEVKVSAIQGSSGDGEEYAFDVDNKAILRETIEFFDTYATKNQGHIDRLKRLARELFHEKGFVAKKAERVPERLSLDDYWCSCWKVVKQVSGRMKCLDGCPGPDYSLCNENIKKRCEVIEKNEEYFSEWGVPLILLGRFIQPPPENHPYFKITFFKSGEFTFFNTFIIKENWNCWGDSKANAYYGDGDSLPEDYVIDLYEKIIGDEMRNIKPVKK